MKHGFACKLSDWSTKKDNQPTILPGIELNIRLEPPLNQMRLHVLVIFPEGSHTNEIERIFPSEIPTDENRNGQEEIRISDLANFIKKIQNDHHGICIAAHVDNSNGVRYLFRQTGKENICLFNPDGVLSQNDERIISESFKDFLESIKFDGIEISSPEHRSHYSWVTEPEEGIEHHVPVFLTFDGHNIENHPSA